MIHNFFVFLSNSYVLVISSDVTSGCYKLRSVENSVSVSQVNLSVVAASRTVYQRRLSALQKYV